MKNSFILFFFRFLKNPLAIGSITPSSLALARAMSESIKSTDRVLEIGAGEGTITRAILEKIPPSQLISVEMDEKLAEQFHKNFPNADLRIDSAQNILNTIKSIDIIISGIPFANLSLSKRDELFNQIFRSLKSNGTFVAFQYTKRLDREFKKRFQNVIVKKVWKNIPPAYIYICRK